MIPGIVAQASTGAPAPIPAILGALAYNSAGPTVSAGGDVAMPSEYYDTDNFHDLVTNNARLTIPSGVSLVRIVGTAENDSEPLAIYKNNASFLGTGTSLSLTGGQDKVNVFTPLIAVTAGDYFTLRNNSGNSEAFAANNLTFGIEVVDAATKHALVNKAATQNISSGTTTVTFGAETADTDNFHDNTTNNSRLTVPSGISLVRVTASLGVNSGSSTQIFAIMQKNGADFVGMGMFELETGAGVNVQVVSAVVAVTAGDYFTLNINSGQSRTINNGNGTWFAIEEVDASIKRALVNRITSNLAVTSGAAMTWNSEVYDTDGIYDAGSPTRLTVPAGCTFARLSFCIQQTNSNSDAIARVTKNGSSTTDGGLPWCENNTFGTDNQNAIGQWVPVTPGDYFELIIEATSPTVNASPTSWFCGEFV